MREIRSYGSARGVRSNPYPYRDIPTPAAVGSALLTFPRHGTSGGQDTPEPTSGTTQPDPPPWPSRHTAGLGSGGDLAPHSAAKPTRTRAGIVGLEHLGIGNGTAEQNGMAISA